MEDGKKKQRDQTGDFIAVLNKITSVLLQGKKEFDYGHHIHLAAKLKAMACFVPYPTDLWLKSVHAR